MEDIRHLAVAALVGATLSTGVSAGVIGGALVDRDARPVPSVVAPVATPAPPAVAPAPGPTSLVPVVAVPRRGSR